MSKRISDHIRSNLVGYVAVFLALTGTAIAAAPRNSVTSKSIKNGAVKSIDIGNLQVANADLAPNSVDSSKVLDNSLSGTDVNESTLSGVDAETLNGLTPDEFQFGNGNDVGAGTFALTGTETILGLPDGSMDLTCGAAPTLTYTDDGTDGDPTDVWVSAPGSFTSVAENTTSAPINVNEDAAVSVIVFDGLFVTSVQLGIHQVGITTTCHLAETAQLNF